MNLKIDAARQALATAKDEYQRRLVMIDRMLASAVAQDPKNRSEAEAVQAEYGPDFVRGELPDYSVVAKPGEETEDTPQREVRIETALVEPTETAGGDPHAGSVEIATEGDQVQS